MHSKRHIYVKGPRKRIKKKVKETESRLQTDKFPLKLHTG